MGGAKLKTNLRPGPEKSRELARCALVAAAGAAMATAMKASASQTKSHVRGVAWRVAAEEGVPADFEDVDQHLQTVAEHADFRCRGMAPANRNFDRPQTMMPGQIEQFGVETEALDGLLFKNNAATFAVESLEAALGVDKRQPQDDANDFVEYDAGKFAKRRLVNRD